MNVVVGILVLVIGLAISIGLHEIGHMVPAKKFGVRVSQYMIGFGPTIWSRTKGETEYGVKAIPLGGYIRMIGMFPPKPEASRHKDGEGWAGQVVADARDASVEEILPGEEGRAFYNLSTPKKLTIMLGGPVMNLVLAVVLTSLAFAIGFTQQTTTVNTVSQCVPTATGEPCDPATDPAPAALAGLAPGDRIVAFDGVTTRTWASLVEAIDGTAGHAVQMEVMRGDERLTLTVTPVEATRALIDLDGNPITDDEGATRTVTSHFIGVGPTIARAPVSQAEVPAEVGRLFNGTAGAVIRFPVAVYNAAAQTFTGAERGPDGVMSVVGVGTTLADVYSLDAPILDRVAISISLLASLNMALFVFNLIPLLPLDGGHVANALFEGGRRTVARMRGRARPEPSDVARMMPITYVVFGILLLSTVLLVIADVANPIRIFA